MQIPPAQEAQLIVRSLRVTTLPKLAFADTRRFVDLVADVFPGVSVSDVSDAELEAAIAATCREMKLEAVRAQVDKVLQLHVACRQRIGVIVVGPSGTGKVTLCPSLRRALRTALLELHLNSFVGLVRKACFTGASSCDKLTVSRSRLEVDPCFLSRP